MTRSTVRRQVATSIAAGVGLVLVLASCSGSSGGGGGGDTGGSDAAGGPLTELGENEGQINILAWPGYVEDGSNDPAYDWITPFEDQTGCQVNSKIYNTSDEGFNLMQTGEYDVISASGDASLRLVAAGAVQPVNTDLITNWDGVYDFLKNRAWNTVDGQSYGTPHGYGANLLGYDSTIFTTPPTSWAPVFEDAAQNAGKISAYDSPIYIADAAVRLMATNPDLGITNPYALDQTQFDAAIALLKDQRQYIGEYWSDYLLLTQSFESGNTVASTTWQVIQNTFDADPASPIKAILPDEGATGWSDTWMIAADAPNVNCAYAWLDYIISPEANGIATGYFGEAPATQAACDFREDCEAYHAGDAEYESQIWYWTTPIAQCLDGRTDVTCIDYSQWTTAWQEIKG
jgi:putative spermidine/putrescine transport system substrate-binding protein